MFTTLYFCILSTFSHLPLIWSFIFTIIYSFSPLCLLCNPHLPQCLFILSTICFKDFYTPLPTPFSVAHYHRITAWFELEWTLKPIQFQLPCHRQRCQPLDQAAQGLIQGGLEHLQGRGNHTQVQSLPLPSRAWDHYLPFYLPVAAVLKYIL